MKPIKKYKAGEIIRLSKFLLAEIRRGNVALAIDRKNTPALALPQNPLIIDEGYELDSVIRFLTKLRNQWRKYGWP